MLLTDRTGTPRVRSVDPLWQHYCDHSSHSLARCSEYTSLRHSARHPLNDIVLLHPVNAVLSIATASLLECYFGCFPGAKKGPTVLRSSSSFTEFGWNLSLYSYCPPTCYNSLSFSVNALSLNCHKFILAFQITGLHTDLIVT